VRQLNELTANQERKIADLKTDINNIHAGQEEFKQQTGAEIINYINEKISVMQDEVKQYNKFPSSLTKKRSKKGLWTRWRNSSRD
jgi:hypothetical protein